MRPLAFTYDHAFVHPQARQNLAGALEKLKVPLVANRDDSAQKR